MTKRKIAYWVIPPELDTEFVAYIGEVLERYEQAYDPARPVLCMDEQPIQLIGETRRPLDAPQDHPRRVDYDYDRLGPASISMLPNRFRDLVGRVLVSDDRRWLGLKTWPICSIHAMWIVNG